jgi:hypothetical protein
MRRRSLPRRPHVTVVRATKDTTWLRRVIFDLGAKWGAKVEEDVMGEDRDGTEGTEVREGRARSL